MMKNFIFDIDGTLIDTIKMYIPAMQEVLAQHGYNRSYSELTGYFGIPSKEALEGAKVKPAEFKTIIDEWFKLAYSRADQVTIFAGIEETLSKLNKMPDVNLAIVTSKSLAEYQQEFKKRYPLIANYFHTVITADDTTSHKPNPEPILTALQKGAFAPENTMYIGDTIHDLQAAHGAKIKFGAAIWGSAQPENLKQADFQLTRPAELLNLVH